MRTERENRVSVLRVGNTENEENFRPNKIIVLLPVRLYPVRYRFSTRLAVLGWILLR